LLGPFGGASGRAHDYAGFSAGFPSGIPADEFADDRSAHAAADRSPALSLHIKSERRER
jgi:hypothetical protein